MSSPRLDHPAFIFTAVLFAPGVDTQKVINELKTKIGDILISSREIAFVWSDYYEPEMGKDLKRIFVVYKEIIQRDKIVRIKRITDEMEKEYLKDGKRTINIDPGLLCLENIILATNKPFFHRIYLTDGVYAEVTLFYKHGSFNPIEYWTYPEYRSTPVLDFFNKCRTMLAENLDRMKK
ncbi:MAG: DUF4416 family protein [Proteobacteria bacterium]|nr:DUF4416 family protein [Pseudomonadota bacterium]